MEDLIWVNVVTRHKDDEQECRYCAKSYVEANAFAERLKRDPLTHTVGIGLKTPMLKRVEYWTRGSVGWKRLKQEVVAGGFGYFGPVGPMPPLPKEEKPCTANHSFTFS